MLCKSILRSQISSNCSSSGVYYLHFIYHNHTFVNLSRKVKFKLIPYTTYKTQVQSNVVLPPSHNVSKKNIFSLSQNISKKNKLLSFSIFFLFTLIKLNANYFQFSLSFIFSITNSQ